MLGFFSQIPSSQCLMYVSKNWNSSWVTLIKIPSSKLTWQWKSTFSNRKYFFKCWIFCCYVSLPEGRSRWKPSPQQQSSFHQSSPQKNKKAEPPRTLEDIPRDADLSQGQHTFQLDLNIQSFQENYNTPVEHTPGNPPTQLWKESLYGLLVKV